MLKLRMGQNPMAGSSSYSSGSGGGVRSWRMYSGHSDNDLPPQRHSASASRGHHYSRSGGGGVMSGRAARSLSGQGADQDNVSKSLSPDRETRTSGAGGSGGGGGGDSDDVESLVSFVSGTSALSTQSERPSAYMKRGG